MGEQGCMSAEIERQNNNNNNKTFVDVNGFIKIQTG